MSMSASRVLVGLILSAGLCFSVVSCSSVDQGRRRQAARSPSVSPAHVDAVACPYATAAPSSHQIVHILLANGTDVPGSAHRVVVRPGTRIVATARLMNVSFLDPSATNNAVLARLAIRRHHSRPVSVTATFLAVKPGKSRIIAKEPPAPGIGLFAVSTFVRVRCDNPTTPTAQ